MSVRRRDSHRRGEREGEKGRQEGAVQRGMRRRKDEGSGFSDP